MASPFSGRAGRLASIWQATYLRDQQAELDKRINEGRDRAIGAINAGEPLSLAALGKGYDSARTSYGDAMGLYGPYRTTGLDAWKQYADATGVNGQEGFDRSVGLYRASPGYERRVAESTDAVARKQSALGALGSGNTMQAISDRAGYLADEDYGKNYLDRLKGVSDVGYAATGAMAGLTKGIGDLYGQQGRDEAGIYGDNARARAGIFGDSTRLGTLAQQNTTQGIASAVHGGMMSGQEAAATRLNFGLGLLGSGLKLAGMGTGNGNTLAGSLFNRWG